MLVDTLVVMGFVVWAALIVRKVAADQKVRANIRRRLYP